MVYFLSIQRKQNEKRKKTLAHRCERRRTRAVVAALKSLWPSRGRAKTEAKRRNFTFIQNTNTAKCSESIFTKLTCALRGADKCSVYLLFFWRFCCFERTNFSCGNSHFYLLIFTQIFNVFGYRFNVYKAFSR